MALPGKNIGINKNNNNNKDTTSMDMEMGKELVCDAWDYKGRSADRPNSGGWKAAAMILGLFSLSISLPFLVFTTPACF